MAWLRVRDANASRDRGGLRRPSSFPRKFAQKIEEGLVRRTEHRHIGHVAEHARQHPLRSAVVAIEHEKAFAAALQAAARERIEIGEGIALVPIR